VAANLGTTGIPGFAERAAAHLSAIAAYLRMGQPVNTTHFFWDTLIREFRFPFVKKELLLRNPMSVPNLGDVSGLLAQTAFPQEAIRELYMHTVSSLAPALPIDPSEPAGRVEEFFKNVSEATRAGEE
jgi:hypothetical protein